MNFRPELAEKVMAGAKTVTRRLVSENPRSPWWRERCSLVVGRDYAVCPGRSKPAIGRVRVVAVDRQRLELSDVDMELEARREGFGSLFAFMVAWEAINGSYDPQALVWRVELEALPG